MKRPMLYKWRMNEWNEEKQNIKIKTVIKFVAELAPYRKHREKNAINSTDCSVTISQNSTSDNAISKTSTISQ